MPVRLALIGLGRWAQAHAAAAQRSDQVEMVACYSRDAARREAFAVDNKICWAAPSFEAVLASGDIDGVVLSTPNDLHVEMTLEAGRAGKAVLVDKPVAVDVGEGLQLLRRAADLPPVGVAHHARRLAGHRVQQGWITSGRAGVVQVAHATFSNNRSLAMQPGAWHRHARGSEGGVLIQVGIHHVDTLMHLLGPVHTVNARFGYGHLGPDMPVIAVVVMTHDSGAVSTVASSWTTPSYYRLDLQATAGRFEYHLDHRFWTHPEVDAHSVATLWPADAEQAQVDLSRHAGDPLCDQLNDFAGSITGAQPPPVSVLEGLRASAVVEAAVESARRDGQAVAIAEVARRHGASTAEVAQLTAE